jgi:feruloyl-CoA synthase
MNTVSSQAPVRYRAMRFGITRAVLRDGREGVRYLRAENALDGYAHRMTDRLVHWAETEPERVFIARRSRKADGSTGDWISVSYRQALAQARSIGQALLDRKLDAERPVAILSENGIDHALLALGCLYVGIPHCPVSPAYSLVSQDFEKLRHVLATLTPGLVFATDARYAGRSRRRSGPTWRW